jgi:threonine dehydratase
LLPILTCRLTDYALLARLRSQIQVVVEPSAAVGVAAVLSPQWSTASGPAASTGAGSGQGTAGQVQGVLAGCERVGVILCGGNVSLDKLGTWFAGSS